MLSFWRQWSDLRLYSSNQKYNLAGSSVLCKCDVRLSWDIWVVVLLMKYLLHSIDHASGHADSLPMLWPKELKEMTKGTNHGNYVFKKRFQKLLYKKTMQIFLMWAWFIYHNCILCIKKTPTVSIFLHTENNYRSLYLLFIWLCFDVYCILVFIILLRLSD